MWPVAVIFLLVIGGIYRGIFTPTEGAAVGAAATGVIALFRKMSWDQFTTALIETAKTTGMIYLILIGAEIYGPSWRSRNCRSGSPAWYRGWN